ncbi:MAG: S16 family serine protease [Actinomycetota bacterium]
MTEEDTPTQMLPPEPLGSVAPPGRAWHRDPFNRGVAAIVVLTIVGVIAYATVPAQWAGRIIPGNSIVDDGAVALKPGSARPTDDRVALANIEIFEPEGEILFTTVAIDDQVTISDWVRSERDDAVELRARSEVFGTRTASEQRERNLQLMQASKDTAVVAALEYLGVEAIIESGVGFNQVVEDGPSAGLMEVGEIIVAIDDEIITGIESLLDALAARGPGTSVTLQLENNDTGEFRTQDVTLGVHPDETNDGGFIGIADVTVRAVDADLPFDVAIDSGAIGGPSAGLAFTLTLIDVLTPGELTGANRVAVTGTITASGLVGNVGGVAQKAAAAEDEGVAMFIVPIDLVEAAESTTDDLRVVGVATLDEALAALAELGGDVGELALEIPGGGSS